MTRPLPQRGFVLLMALIVLALVAVVLLDLSRRSLRRAVEASQAEQALRWRWATTSARAALLPRAESLLDRSSADPLVDPLADPPTPREGERGPRWEVAVTVTLNDEPFLLRVSDEGAKANLNTIFHTNGPSAAQRAAQEAAGGARDLGRVRLSPVAEAAAPQTRPAPSPPEAPPPEASPPEASQPPEASNPPEALAARVFGSWAQVYPEAPPHAVLAIPAPGARPGEQPDGPARYLTLWGDGRLHLARAPRQAAEAVLGPVLGLIATRRLLDARTAQPEAGVDAWVAAAELGDDAAAALRQRIAEEPGCYALRVASGPRVDWSVLQPADPEADGDTDRFWRLAW